MPTEQLEENGHFWLARDTEGEHAVHGSLKLSPDGIATLRVFSPLVPHENSLLSRDLEKEPHIRVLGITESNRKITIDDASASGIGYSFGTGTGVDTRNFSSDNVVIGALFEESRDLSFFEATVQLENLFEWFGLSGIREMGRSKGRQPLSITVEYNQPPAIDIEWRGATEAEIFFGWSDPGVVPWAASWDFRQSCSIVLRREDDFWTLSDVEMMALSLQSFLAVATGTNVSITKQNVRCRGQFDEQLGREVDIQCPARNHRDDDALAKTSHPLQMPLQFKVIEDHFPEILTNWWEMVENNEQAIRLMMASRYEKHSWQEHFLRLTKAVEASLGKEMPKRTSFRRVVQCLAMDFSREFTRPLDVQEFARAVTKYRNWFTHYDKKSESIDVDYGEVRALVYNLRALLDLYFVRKVLPDGRNHQDFLYREGKLCWSMQRYLQPNAKHVITDQASDT